MGRRGRKQGRGAKQKDKARLQPSVGYEGSMSQYVVGLIAIRSFDN